MIKNETKLSKWSCKPWFVGKQILRLKKDKMKENHERKYGSEQEKVAEGRDENEMRILVGDDDDEDSGS